ncbi:SAM-dependent RNA methyltransferase [Neohortaea acidophila]|uniref:SAM-dependent RNA methyltransferase n=1 Tax=Neohortaea acidophila TaxID=245834 RepID=A0A6A6PJC1_9PEZI|nr:SAM-dependent RNA methyltransferase [Neohortaea acidophila]KAF2480092.1 SAM-dependent RNA methyltransferase [Neohortaea acidophila]
MGSVNGVDQRYRIIVEHLDSELEDWQALEYKCIARECSANGWSFVLSGLSSPAETKQQLGLPATSLTQQGVESLFSTAEERQQVCLLDPRGSQDLAPEDGEKFKVFLFGGILGDDPPRDRTGELRRIGFPGRKLGPEQMTTDTAARVTRMVIQDKVRLQDIQYVNRPELNLSATKGEDATNASESVSMPFKYVKGQDGAPVMPEV